MNDCIIDWNERLLRAHKTQGNEANTLLATVDNKTYQLTNDDIKDGDSVYSEFAKAIDKCIKKFEDDTMCVEFKSGMRAVLSTKHYKKAVLQ